MSEIENKAWLETIDRIVPPLEPVHENFVAEWALWQDRKRIREELAALVERPTVFASRYDEQLGECVPVEVDPPMLAKLRERVAVERKAEPVAWQWRNGAPPKPWSDEWFIAETTYGDRVVLRSLPEDWTYDFKTADDTYIKADKIKRWMQFPDSQYIAPAHADTEAALSASPSPVDSRDGLIERLVKATEALLYEAMGSGDAYYKARSEACDAISEVLAAKEQQPSPKPAAVSEGGEDE